MMPLGLAMPLVQSTQNKLDPAKPPVASGHRQIHSTQLPPVVRVK